MAENFAIIGTGGFVAPRHLDAIKKTGNRVAVAVDRNDAVGILDKYFPEAKFFLDVEKFIEYIDYRKKNPSEKISFISICTPNYLHYYHAYISMRLGANVICEKPLVINPDHLNSLLEMERETGQIVYGISQLRFSPTLRRLKHEIQNGDTKKREVSLTYITSRGDWYSSSWKSYAEKSGGLAMNIGFHLFDLLLWIFGDVEDTKVYLSERERMAGYLRMQRANVKWLLSVNNKDISSDSNNSKSMISRSLNLDGSIIDFSDVSDSLHTDLFRETLQGNGLKILDLKPAVDLAYDIQNSDTTPLEGENHPMLTRGKNE